MRPFYYIFVSLIIVGTGCVNEINFDVERGTADQLVIEGRIVELLSEANNYAEVNIQKVFNFESSSRSTVSVDEVSITNGDEVLNLPQLGLGRYGTTFNESDYDLSDDKGHVLQVVDLLGRVYESEVVYKPTLAIPESVRFEESSARVINSLGNLVEEERTAIVINTPIIDGSANGLHWEVTQTYQVHSVTPAFTCYVVENPITDNVLLLDTDALNIDRLDNYELFKVPVDKRWREGITFSVRQFSTDEATLEHLGHIQSLLTLTETIFNDPLNKLGTNIRNVNDSEEEVFGHFYATQAYDVRIKQDSIRPYCSSGDATCDPRTGCPVTGARADPLCCDCRKVPGSSTIRPEWW